MNHKYKDLYIKYKGIPHNKSMIATHQATARKKIRWHLKNKLNINTNNMKLMTMIRMFTQHYNIIVGTNQGLKKWLYSTYENGNNEIIRRSEGGFYSTSKWRKLRERVILEYGNKCMKCGVLEESICVDHIKPRSKYPELEYEYSNLQVLCTICNLIKSNKTEVNYRLNC